MDISSILNNSVEKKVKVKRNNQAKHGPQQCQVCGKVFGNASALAKHKLTHSNERKYICTTCTKAFKRQDHLNGHLLTHRNKKPFECDQSGCGKSYCDARSLRRHIENHHKCGMNVGTSKTIIPSTNNGNTSQLDTLQTKNCEMRPRTWNIQMKLQNTNNFETGRSEVLQISDNTSQKMLVECHLCHRNFKNIPALNGHMRLHGGYLKKDLEKVKKVPHLITASVGVRALIGEKIYNKRNIDQILVTPTLPTSIKHQSTILGEQEVSSDHVKEDSQANILLDSKMNRQQVLIPIQLHRRKSFSDKADQELVKPQYDNTHLDLNKNLRQIVYSLDAVNTSTNLEEFKKIFNMQVVQKDLTNLDIKNCTKYVIDDLISLKNFGNDLAIKTNNSSSTRYVLNTSNKLDQSYLMYGSDENVSKLYSMVKSDDPLLSATSKEHIDKKISLFNIKTSSTDKNNVLSKKNENFKQLFHYRPYSILKNKIEVNQQIKPKINIGSSYQAEIPTIIQDYTHSDNVKPQICLWNPDCITNETILENYCSLLKTQIFNNIIKSEEVGLKVLNDVKGEVHLAISKCLHEKNSLKCEDRWTKHEFEYFFFFLKNKGKRFDIMSKGIGTKTSLECVQMYYLVKKTMLQN